MNPLDNLLIVSASEHLGILEIVLSIVEYQRFQILKNERDQIGIEQVIESKQS